MSCFLQTRQFLPTKNILAVERVDESTFQTPNVFQMVSKDDDGALLCQTDFHSYAAKIFPAKRYA